MRLGNLDIGVLQGGKEVAKGGQQRVGEFRPGADHIIPIVAICLALLFLYVVVSFAVAQEVDDIVTFDRFGGGTQLCESFVNGGPVCDSVNAFAVGVDKSAWINQRHRLSVAGSYHEYLLTSHNAFVDRKFTSNL